jgi:hypothetical protein
MSTLIQGSQLRVIEYGNRAVRTAQALPQTATGTLFTVTGGLVIIKQLLGIVTTVIQSTDPVLSLGMAPTVGTAQTSGIAATEPLSSAEVGTPVSLADASVVAGTPDTYTPGKLMVGIKAGSIMALHKPFIVPAGTITWTTTASKTGAMRWICQWLPLEDGAALA